MYVDTKQCIQLKHHHYPDNERMDDETGVGYTVH